MREGSLDTIHVPLQESQPHFRPEEVHPHNNTAIISSTATKSWGLLTRALSSKRNPIYPMRHFSTILSASILNSSITTKISFNSRSKLEICFVPPTYTHRLFQHNILNDMIKYLADFSRDYIQHIYLWQVKTAKKLE